MNFTYGNIKKDYERLKNALEATHKKVKCNDWEPIDLMNGIYQGNFGFVKSTLNDSDIGVFYVQNLPFSTEKQLWIYVAYSVSGEAFELYLDDWKELAKQCGCSSIGWNSSRLGYLRSLKRLDNTDIHRIEYRINL
ncbi:hypothetical protein [Methylobacter sp.]|uniref:hypothetical protein n=1 Tax=Methylobacter sp. TaxID=2051955 RepID=UPI003DA35855